MLDFLMISTRSGKRGIIEIYPKFIIKKSNDLMIRGGDFYAIWIDERGIWSTDEQDAVDLIDRELDQYAEENRKRFDGNIRVLHMNAAIAKLNEIAAGIGGEEDDYATVMAAIEGKITAAMAGIAQGATKVEKSEINGNIKINGQETVVYTHPAGSAVEAGFKKVGSDASGHVVLGDDVTKEDITKLGIPGQDTTYEKATSEADGLMSKEDKAKLDGMAVAEDTEVQSMLDEIFGATEEEP